MRRDASARPSRPVRSGRPRPPRPAAPSAIVAAGAVLVAIAGLQPSPASSQIPTPTPTPTPSPTASPAPAPTETPTPTPAPPPATPAPPTPTPTPTPDLTPPLVAVTTLTRMRSSLTAHGLKVQVTLNEPGSVSVFIRDARQQQLSKPSTGLASMPEGGSRTVTVKLTPGAKIRARRTAKIRWTVEVLAYDGRGNLTVRRLPFRIG